MEDFSFANIKWDLRSNSSRLHTPEFYNDGQHRMNTAPFIVIKRVAAAESDR